jgi:microcystin-dependent protein
MSDQFLAEIRAFPFNFAPNQWAYCNGQLLPISKNTALFSLLGTYYGGDGRSTFALPNLQGRLPICYGQGAGLSFYDIGQNGGEVNVTLLVSQMSSHSHNLMAAEVPPAASQSPSGGALGFKPTVTNIYTTATSPIAQFAQPAIGPAGGNLPHNNMMPFLTLNFCIALQGIFPPRS